ncbi:MAG: hypothetical protein ACFFA0_02165 [Promethearchaeota archaeon]
MKLTEIDGLTLLCYLHTENEKTIKLYEYFEFEIVDNSNTPNSELKSWAMIRKKVNY